jgi:hypothetical protein
MTESIFEFSVLAGTSRDGSVKVLIQVSGLQSDPSEPARHRRRAMCQTMVEGVTRSAAQCGVTLAPVDVTLAEAIDQL